MAARDSGASATEPPPKAKTSARPDLEPLLRNLPRAPGVYLFRDKQGRVLYIGKAAVLRSRVRSYFRTGGDGRAAIPLIVRQVADLETIVTSNEKEALILEDTLIKEHRPRYNVRLRDDKSYIWLRLRMDHPAPWLERVRRPKPDGNPTFGPFPNGLAARETAKVLHDVFPLRTCSNNKFSHRSRPCLDHQIGKCPAPCTGEISPEAYREIAEGARRFLAGERRELLRHLRAEMERASGELRFEDAAMLRDRLRSLEHTSESQVADRGGAASADYWGWSGQGGQVSIVVLRTVEGKLVDREAFPPRQAGPEASVDQWLMQFYIDQREIPERICLPAVGEGEREPDLDLLAQVLSERRGKKVRLLRPQRGEGRRLLELAARNAEARFAAGTGRDPEQEAEELARLLKLPRPPQILECYDVSVHQGAEPVGVGICFERGIENPDRRRRYRLESGEGLGDVQWMQQMLERRLRRGIREQDFPDLIVLDGGRSQLDAVLHVYARLEVEWAQAPVIALAKARTQFDARGQAIGPGERLILPGRLNPVLLRTGSPAFRLVVSLRDATHRAAVGYHRQRGRSSLLAGLERVPGLGPARRRALQDAYPNLAMAAQASADDVRRATGMPAAVVREVQATLRRLHAGQAFGTLNEDTHTGGKPT